MDSEWWEWNTDLAKDIHDTLKQKECCMLRLKGHSKLLYWRRYLVDWLALTCQKYKLNTNVQHLAVCLYDRFTDQFDLASDDVQLLILCCLLIASKFEEREEKIPKFKTLMQQLHWKLESNEYLQMEVRILSAFKWKIGFPTASHFKEYYMQVVLNSRDVMAGRPITAREETLIYLEKNINYFLEVSLQDQAFLLFKPSLVTAACIAAARICLRIAPTWSTELQQATYFTWQKLTACIEILLRLYDEDRKVTQKCSSKLVCQRNLDSIGGTPVQSPIDNTASSSVYGKAYCPVSLSQNRLSKGYLV